MVNPVPGYGVTTAYKKRGSAWSLGFHTGADISGAVIAGKPIVAATPGEVIAANAYDKAYGYKVIIRWGSYDVWYCHMPKNAATVKVGQTVTTGQQIGTVGSTGNTTGPHLHLELRVAGGGFAASNFRDPKAAINYEDPKPPPRATAVWGKPDTWRIGSIGPDVTRLGQQLEKWAKHYGLPKPYTVGPGPEFTEVDRRAVEAFQKKQGWTGMGADGFPGAETFKRVAVDPSKPAEYVAVGSAVQNVAGYNAPNRPGVTQYKTHIPRIAKAVDDSAADIFDVQELSAKRANPMRTLLAKCLPDWRRSPDGTDGRYVHYRLGAVEKVAGGHYSAGKKSLFKSDTKQAAWFVFDKDGARGMDVSFHLESDAGAAPDALRVAQMLDFLHQTILTATKYQVPLTNVLLTGDTNSEGMVAAAMKAAGWPAIANTKPTFRGWDRRSSKRLDYGFVLSGVKASCKVVRSDDSDHERLIVTRQLTK